MYHYTTKHACFFVLEHRERSTAGSLAFLEELTPAGRASSVSRSVPSAAPGQLPSPCTIPRAVPAPSTEACPGLTGAGGSGEAGDTRARGRAGTGRARTHTPWLRRPPAFPAPPGRRGPRGLPGLAVPGPGRGSAGTSLTHGAFERPRWSQDRVLRGEMQG